MGVVIWSNGRLHGPEDLLLSGVDHGLTVGDGVFETCAVYDGTAFALTRHLRRLKRSALGLGLAAPDEGAVREGVAAVLADAGPDVGRLRITLTGGPGPLGSNRFAPEEQRQSILVLAGPGARSEVSRVIRVPWVRNERSSVVGLKTTSYAENVVAVSEAYRRGADEAVLANTVGRAVRGHRVERVRRARRRAGDAAAVERLPGRHHPGAACWSGRRPQVSPSARLRRGSSGTRCSTTWRTGRRT